MERGARFFVFVDGGARRETASGRANPPPHPSRTPPQPQFSPKVGTPLAAAGPHKQMGSDRTQNIEFGRARKKKAAGPRLLCGTERVNTDTDLALHGKLSYHAARGPDVLRPMMND